MGLLLLSISHWIVYFVLTWLRLTSPFFLGIEDWTKMIPYTVETSWLHFLDGFSLYKTWIDFPWILSKNPNSTFTTSTAILNPVFYPFQSFNISLTDGAKGSFFWCNRCLSLYKVISYTQKGDLLFWSKSLPIFFPNYKGI